MPTLQERPTTTEPTTSRSGKLLPISFAILSLIVIVASLNYVKKTKEWGLDINGKSGVVE